MDAPTLFPYQVEGAAFLAANRRAMLLDEPGLGKTAQAIEACNLVDARSVLVICPASLRTNWHREFERFGNGSQHVTSESYDKVARDPKKFEGPWDAVIIDEAHYCKTVKAKRTKAIYGTPKKPGIVGLARYVFALTGTPAPNNPSEMFTHMRALFPKSLFKVLKPTERYDQWSFTNRYCVVKQTGFGEKIVGGKNHADLKERLSPYVLRRKKTEVLPDLPEIRYEALLLDSPAAVASLRKSADSDEMQLLVDALEKDGVEGLQGVAPHVASLRRVTALAKAAPVIDWAKDFLEQTDRKLVVFAQHRDVIKAVAEGLGSQGVVSIHGGTTQHHRQEAVDKFQNEKGFRVFVGQTQAAGTGLTLTAASDLVFVEQSWVPADNSQAAMRIHRIGQKSGCLVRYAVLAGSIDEAVQKALARKTADISQIFD